MNNKHNIERCKFCSTDRIIKNGKRELKNKYSEFCVECKKWANNIKKNCPECQFEAGEHSFECSKYIEPKYNIQEDWKKSLNINQRFAWVTLEQRNHILIEIKFQRKAKDKEFIEILNGLKMKKRTKIDKNNPFFKTGRWVWHGYNQAVKEFNNKIKQIKKKYE